MATRGEEVQAKLLSILRRQHVPQSAYDLLKLLRSDQPRIAPPTVYRALDALMKKGSVHRLESQSAFVACQHGNHPEGCILAVCRECGGVVEHVSPSLIDDLSAEAAAFGFDASRHVVEIHGRCAECGSNGTMK